MSNHSKEELQQLKLAADELRTLEGRSCYPLTPELLEQLVHRVQKSNNIDDLFGKYSSSGCGCMGARNNELYCNCSMNQCLYEYRYDVALFILDNMSSEIKPI